MDEARSGKLAKDRKVQEATFSFLGDGSDAQERS